MFFFYFVILIALYDAHAPLFYTADCRLLLLLVFVPLVVNANRGIFTPVRCS